MLYSYLYRLAAWLEYSVCYCLITSQVLLEDPTDGEYQLLADDILDSSQSLYDIIFAKNNGDKTSYDCFL